MNRESQMAHGIVGKYKVLSGINVHVAFRILCPVSSSERNQLFFFFFLQGIDFGNLSR